MLQDKIFKLKGKVQNYAWGGYEFIPAWLGIENKEQKPYAEYWMGAHPSASSDIVTPNGELSLNQMIADQHESFTGQKVFDQFGELPYLFKILDVRDMLSIQVHPTKAAAEKGFNEEESGGIKIDSSFRNYKDRNHKPEIMIALSDFWLLHGFLKEADLKKVLCTVPEFKGLEKIFDDGNYKALYEYVMRMPQDQVNNLLTPLVRRELQQKQNNNLTKDQPGWWCSKLYEGKEEFGNIDRGVFSIYFFNIVKTNAGEAVFQAAGVPHAYLEGQNVELMANSDNVLRGGLTTKHVDVPELLKHIIFSGLTPVVMKGENLKDGEINYQCPVSDFGISKIELHPGEAYDNTSASLEIFVVMEGEMEIKGSVNNLSVKKGEAAAILFNETYQISTGSHVLAYKAFVP